MRNILISFCIILLVIVAILIMGTIFSPIILSFVTNNLMYIFLYFVIGIPIVIEIKCFTFLFNIIENEKFSWK